MKSLDNLIRHLIEEVALCGDHGATTLDFVNFVDAYYGQESGSSGELPTNGSENTPVDRKLLEKAWLWLERHPEIQVGADGRANKLSLSEVERRNASLGGYQQVATVDHAPSTAQQHPPVKTPSVATSAGKGNMTSKHTTSPKGNKGASSHPQGSLRMYATTGRRWQAIAGHAPDPIKIPGLDFACLSIIAAHRERGILQPDLVRISGQDKRSVPERTRRLQEGGYISKIPVLVNKAHTSKLTLKRYVPSAVRNNSAELASDADQTLQGLKNSVGNIIDFQALQHKIFDILREVKLITLNELKDRMGVTGLPWPMRLLASHLRRLEHIGCIKQVRAHPQADSNAPFLFRCVKYIRDPQGKEWQPINFPSRNRSQPMTVENVEADVLSDDEQDYQAEEARYLAGVGGSRPLKGLQEVERAIPQWSGDDMLSNLLYNLVHASGTQGLSTMELKNRSMGCFMIRPTENYLSKLVEMWQMSQPLHLRHLAIVRDTALTNGIPHYVHYSFPNFKKLVDEGRASWEAVMTVTKEHKQFKHVAALEAEPELDENGFPKLPDNLFQGRHNDANLAECIKGADNSPPSLSSWDPRVVKLDDGSWGIFRCHARSLGLQSRSQVQHPRSRERLKRSHAPIHDVEPDEPGAQARMPKQRKIDREPNLIVKALGRGRKIQAEGLPLGFDRLPPAQRSKILHSQGAAKQYKKSKLVAEIEKQVSDGADRYETIVAVIALAVKQYRDDGQEPPWEIMEWVRSDALAPTLQALERSKATSTLNTAVGNQAGGFKRLLFKPSISAHSRPLREIEMQTVSDGLRSRIHILQSIPMEGTIQGVSTAMLPHSDHGQVIEELSGRKADGAKPNIHTPSGYSKGKWPRQKKAKAPRKPKSNISRPKVQNSSSQPTTIGGIPDQYLPSVAAHTWLVPSIVSVAAELPTLKRKRSVDEMAQIKRPKRERKKVQLDLDDGAYTKTSASRPRQPPVRTYQQQLDNISRSAPGLYVGEEAKLLQAGKLGAKRRSRLAVFRFSNNQVLSNLHLQANIVSSARPNLGSDRSDFLREHEAATIGERILSHMPAKLINDADAAYYDAGDKRKRSMGDDARRESVPLPPTPFMPQKPAYSSSLDASTAVGLEENSNVQQELSPLDGITHVSYLEDNARLPAGPEDRQKRLSTGHDPSDTTTSSNVKASSSQPQVEQLSKEFTTATLSAQRHPAITDITQSIGQISTAGTSDTFEKQRPLDTHTPLGDPMTAVAQSGLTFDRHDSSPLNHLASDNHTVETPTNLGVTTPHRGVTAPVKSSLYRVFENMQGAATGSAVAGNDETADRPSTTQQSQDANAASADESLPQVTVEDTPKAKGKIGIKRLNPHGGSVAAQRKQIAMDIVEKCGGIFPGIRELGMPYQDGWIKAKQSGRVEKEVVQNAVKGLCDSGKLRMLTFSFKDRHGLVVNHKMITKVEISPTDPKVLAMQKNIIRTHPKPYEPEEVEISDEVRETFWNPQGRMKNRTIADLEVDQDRVHLQQIPAHIERWDRREKNRQNRIAEKEREDLVAEAIMAHSGKLPESVKSLGERYFGSLGGKRAEKRLLAIAKRNTFNEPQRKVDRLAGHNKGSAGRETSRIEAYVNLEEEVLKRLAELKQTKRQPKARQLDFSHVLTMKNFDKDLASQLREEELRRERAEEAMAEISQDKVRTPRLPAYARPFRPLAIKPSPPTAKPGPSFVQTGPPVTKKSSNAGLHSREARQQMYTIMEPEHIFHPATGTYSVNFSRSRTLNQIVGKLHWVRAVDRSFHDHADDLMTFEMTTKGFDEARFQDWPFVHYTFPHSHTTAAHQSVKRTGLWYSKVGNSWGYRRVSEHQAAQHPGSATLREGNSALVDTSPLPLPQPSVTPAKRKQSRPLGQFKTRQLTTVDKLALPGKTRALDTTPGDVATNDLPPERGSRKREPVLDADIAQRIVTAVIVVRTLTGGVKRHIDWVLVAKAFEPGYDSKYVSNGWRRIRSPHKVQVQQIEADFYALFLKAYADGLVPPIDYDDLQNYDWAALVDWTIDHIDTPLDATLDLPSQRMQLENLFDLKTGEDSGLSTYFEFDTSSTIAKREAELHKKAWVQPLITELQPVHNLKSEELETAKTWIRANVVTKAESYNPQFARDRLSRFDGKIIEQALKEMLGDRILMQENKGRLIPGRNYDLNEQYLKPLRKKIEASQFHKAPRFKRQIDTALAETGEMVIPEMADDAFIMAVQNMQAHRRVSLTAKNPPMNKWGLAEAGSYKTRLIDKKKLHFDVGMRPTEFYIEGNPLWPLPRPPSSSQSGSSAREKIPLWYDINGDVIPELWRLTVAAAMTVLAMRPGVSVREVEQSVKPTLGLWEVDLLLDWIVQAGVARKMGKGYVTEEWWWLCLDEGKAYEEDTEEGRGEVRDRQGDVRMGNT
ncbi:MAG: hypothetical protein Q9181_004064 [Wetmoreana brouardii]